MYTHTLTKECIEGEKASFYLYIDVFVSYIQREGKEVISFFLLHSKHYSYNIHCKLQ
uniref:Uncharacterized protein n=1 Tax=Physcomitrium patens TaxID=3218 RepID=A0A7I3ZHJ1_PHYPA